MLFCAEGPSSQEVVEGARVQLSCTARTDPRLAKSLVVDWYRHGVLLTLGPGLLKTAENSLILLAAGMTESGGYQCKASTMLGNSQRIQSLLLQVTSYFGEEKEKTYILIILLSLPQDIERR